MDEPASKIHANLDAGQLGQGKMVKKIARITGGGYELGWQNGRYPTVKKYIEV